MFLLMNNTGAAVVTSRLDVSNDFQELAIPAMEIVFVQRMLVRGDSVW